MRFLTSEKDLFLEDGLVCFYSSKSIGYINDILFDFFDKSNKDVLFIDLFYFNFSKRFNIKELPTVILIDKGKEINRITLTSTKTSINDILSW